MTTTAKRKPIKKTVTPQAKPVPRKRGPRAVAKPAAKPAVSQPAKLRTDARAPKYQGKGSKAGAFADTAEQLGWTVQRVRNPDGSKTVHCTREAGQGLTEHVVAYWNQREAFDHEYTMHLMRTDDGEELGSGKTIVNAATGYRLLQATPTEALAVKQPRKRTGNPASARRTPRLPFDPATADDDIVLAAVRGHKIWWRNEFTEELETADVPANGRTPVTITLCEADGPKFGRRMLNWCDHPDKHLNPNGTGFRSAFVNQLVRVK